MKPTGTTRRFTSPLWPRQYHRKDSVLQRIQSIARELEAVQEDLHIHMTESAYGKKGTFLEDANAIHVLSNFKAELDQLRRILWFYIEEMAGKPVAAVDQEQQAKRLQRVTDLLRALAPQPAEPASAMEETGSFFERLNVVIDTYMQEKKPAASTSVRKPESH